MFDCSVFTHIIWAGLPPSTARDSANVMASAFMSESIRLGRDRRSYDKSNAVEMAALQREHAMTANTCGLEDSYGTTARFATP
jgi:hypothetical protein